MDRFSRYLGENADRCLIGRICRLGVCVLLCGCSPVQPFYVNEDGDLSHLVDTATDITYPHVNQPASKEAVGATRPYTVADGKISEFEDLTLEQTIATALQNSHIIQTLGRRTLDVQQTAVAPSDDLTTNPDFARSIYDPSLQETSNQGVAAALAAFDAQLSTSLFWDKTDRPQNVTPDGVFDQIFATILEEDNAAFQAEIAKRAATGTQWFVRNITNYQYSTNPSRFLPSDWFTSLEAELRHPLMRGGGTAINRIPVILARIRNDVELADFEIAVTDLLKDVEQAYWSLYFSYHDFNAAKKGLDSAHTTYRRVKSLFDGGSVAREEEAQAREQFHAFKGAMQDAFLRLLRSESQLRNLIGWAPADGRLIRPIDTPSDAKVDFDWEQIKCESLSRRAEVRRQRWRVKEREMELTLAKNQILPQLDATLLYRWFGQGDQLISSSRRGINFPGRSSTAFDNMTENRFGEWRIGLDFETNLGVRQEFAQIQNAKLQLTRDKKLLEKVEDQVVHQLNWAYQSLESQYATVQTRLFQRAAASDNVLANEVAYEEGQITLNLLLDAQRREAQAAVEFYRALLQYNLAIMEVHYRKGSLLEHNNVLLAEGPWPAKAYFDALRHARQRDASYYVDYGYTRPSVISRGPVKQTDKFDAQEPQVGDDSSDGEGLPTDVIVPQDVISPDEVIEALPAPVSMQREPVPIGAGLRDAPANADPPSVETSTTVTTSQEDSYDWGSILD